MEKGWSLGGVSATAIAPPAVPELYPVSFDVSSIYKRIKWQNAHFG